MPPVPANQMAALGKRYRLPDRSFSLRRHALTRPLSCCWTMMFFQNAFALCEMMFYFLNPRLAGPIDRKNKRI
ncbi:hypothetical protein NKH99_04160 [Mesorhizobium sp. M0854]|uniref:hypothetical protein n=1 Tax=unclassified Mesorhizobium TaxID=325217 RepID=UPI00333C2B4E